MTTQIVEAERVRAQQILETLRQSITINEKDFATLQVARETFDPFRILIVTILSQNCTDIAALRAFRTLDERVGVEATSLSRSKPNEVARAIHAAGLHKQKARAIRQLAKILVKSHSGSLDYVLERPLSEARALLQKLPKVGPKTADVLLGVLGAGTISVDTHVDRVSKRLGFARQKARYDEVRESLMALVKSEDYRSVPLLFMAFGRKICKAPKPRCYECPVEKMCPYPKKTVRP